MVTTWLHLPFQNLFPSDMILHIPTLAMEDEGLLLRGTYLLKSYSPPAVSLSTPHSYPFPSATWIFSQFWVFPAHALHTQYIPGSVSGTLCTLCDSDTHICGQLWDKPSEMLGGCPHSFLFWAVLSWELLVDNVHSGLLTLGGQGWVMTMSVCGEASVKKRVGSMEIFS